MTVTLSFELARDGSLIGAPVSKNAKPDPLTKRAIEAATQAVLRCQPFTTLPVAKYEVWRQIIIDFDPRDLVTPS